MRTIIAIAALLSVFVVPRPPEVRHDRGDIDSATISVRRATPAPTAPPPRFVRPESVVEMEEVLQDAENVLEYPGALRIADRRRLYGDAPLPPPIDWKPDFPGSLVRIDAALEFVRPLVEDDNIRRHSRENLEELEATVLGLFYATDWLETAKAHYIELRHMRDNVGTDPTDLIELARKAQSLLGFRSPSPLEVLADEVLSWELESGSEAPRPAPPFRSEMRAQLPGGAYLTKRELRVLAWLRENRDTILEAERAYQGDRRAIGAVIAWEAMENIMRRSLRGVGPGKTHIYSDKWWALMPLLPKGKALAQQAEALHLVPEPASEEERRSIMLMPAGSTKYIAAGMHAAADIAARYGYDISHDLVALTTFYQGHDLPSWDRHMRMKSIRGEKISVAVDPMAVWTQSHVGYLESVLGPSTFSRCATDVSHRMCGRPSMCDTLVAASIDAWCPQ